MIDTKTTKTVLVAVLATVAGRILWEIIGGDDRAENIAKEVRLRL